MFPTRYTPVSSGIGTHSKQSGMALMLLVSIMLIVSLMVSLTGFRATYFQVKQAQNEIEATENFWLVEAGLECAYSQIKHNEANIGPPEVTSHCGLPEALSIQIDPLSPMLYIIRSTYKGAVVSKRFSYRIANGSDSAMGSNSSNGSSSLDGSGSMDGFDGVDNSDIELTTRVTPTREVSWVEGSWCDC